MTELAITGDQVKQGWKLLRCSVCSRLYWVQVVRDGQYTFYELLAHPCDVHDIQLAEVRKQGKVKRLDGLMLAHRTGTEQKGFRAYGQPYKVRSTYYRKIFGQWRQLFKHKRKLTPKPKAQPIPLEDKTPLDYTRLEAEWLDWYKVAYRYARKVPFEERQDYLHEIMIELFRQRLKDNKPLPDLRAYRIASFIVADYWRRSQYPKTLCCVLSGEAKQSHCKSCTVHTDKHTKCAYLASRPIRPISLELPVRDVDGFEVELKDTIADDKALDVPAWIDMTTWLLGCPVRLIEIAEKRERKINLTEADRKYLYKWRTRYQKTLL